MREQEEEDTLSIGIASILVRAKSIRNSSITSTPILMKVSKLSIWVNTNRQLFAFHSISSSSRACKLSAST